MPSGMGPLRIAVQDFLETNPLSKWITEHWATVKNRQVLAVDLINQAAAAEGIFFGLLGSGPRTIAALLYVLTGEGSWLDGIRKEIKKPAFSQAEEDYAQFWKNHLSDSTKAKEFEALGAFFSEPVLALISGLQADPNETPEQYLRRVYGVLLSIVLAPSIGAIAAEVAGLGQIETVMAALQSVASSVGIGSVGGIVTAAFLESGILPELGRSLKDRLRPTRFTESNIRDLYALGKVSQVELIDQLRKAGWRDIDIQLWIALAFRQFSIGELFDLYHQDKITRDRVVEGLRAQGVRPDDIQLMFDLNPSTETANAADVTYRTAKTAFVDQIIDEPTYRGILKFLDRSAAEIEILVATGKHDVAEKSQRLTQSAIKAGWQNNVLTDAEARHWLGELHLAPEVIDTTLEIWTAEAAPKFLKLNTGTITAAYVAGVIDRPAASQRLKEIGHTLDDAGLILNLAEARNPDAFGKPTISRATKLGYGTLAALLSQGLITVDRLIARLVEEGYSQDDADLLGASASLAVAQKARPLRQSDILNAWLVGVLDRTGAANHLTALGYIDADVATILDSFERAHPEVFAPESVQSLRTPSVNSLTDAYRNGIIDQVAFYAAMADLGYDKSAVAMYAALATTHEKKGIKLLSPSDILALYKAALLSYQETLTRLTGQGYSEGDALLLMQLHLPKLEATDAWQNWVAGLIGDQSMVQQILGSGYTTEQLDAALTKFSGGLSGTAAATAPAG